MYMYINGTQWVHRKNIIYLAAFRIKVLDPDLPENTLSENADLHLSVGTHTWPNRCTNSQILNIVKIRPMRFNKQPTLIIYTEAGYKQVLPDTHLSHIIPLWINARILFKWIVHVVLTSVQHVQSRPIHTAQYRRDVSVMKTFIQIFTSQLMYCM